MGSVLASLTALVGAALLVYAVVLRLGRDPGSRAWAHADERTVGIVMMTLPSAGAGLLLFGVLLVDDAGLEPLSAVVVLVCAPLAFFLGVPAGLRLRTPVWCLPQWARDDVRRRRAAEERAGR